MTDVQAIGEHDETAPMEVGRLLALTDGVFAIALTLLVLSLSVDRGLSGDQLLDKLRHDVLPEFGSAALSFAVIGVFWIGHHRLFARVERTDTRLLRLNLVFLAPIVVMPFSTELLARYGSHPVGVVIYAGTIAVTAACELAIRLYLDRRPALLGPPDVDGPAGAPVYLALVAAIFALSIPIAFWSPDGAKYFWLTLPVASRATNTVATRRRRP